MARKTVKRLWSYLDDVSYPLEKGIEEFVDEDIRGLVLELNRKGFRTRASCQGGEGHQWATAEVSFQNPWTPTDEDIAELRSIVKIYTDVPFHFNFLKGKLTGIVFRDPIGGSFVYDVGMDSGLWYHPDTEKLDLEEAIKSKREDESFWEK